MALLSDEPRVASVRAAGRTICLCLSKADFRQALSFEAFGGVVSRIQADRRRTRGLRPRPAANKKAKSVSDMPISGLPQAIGRRYGSLREILPKDTSAPLLANPVYRVESDGAEFIAGYRVLSKLGRGSQGKVLLCESAQGGRFAIKVLAAPRRNLSLNHRDACTFGEVSILRRLRHRNVVEFIDAFEDPLARVAYLVLGLMPSVLMREDEPMRAFPESDCRR